MLFVEHVFNNYSTSEITLFTIGYAKLASPALSWIPSDALLPGTNSTPGSTFWLPSAVLYTKYTKKPWRNITLNEVELKKPNFKKFSVLDNFFWKWCTRAGKDLVRKTKWWSKSHLLGLFLTGKMFLFIKGFKKGAVLYILALKVYLVFGSIFRGDGDMGWHYSRPQIWGSVF